jgi:hypothetical protein
MRDQLQVEVDQNYDYFQRHLAGLLKEHAGQYSLLKSAAVVGFYEGPGEAYRAGLALFSDEIFSVQKVTDQTDDLGFLSIALA